MRTIPPRLLLGLCLLQSASAASAPPADAITGVWLVESEKGDAHVEIYRSRDGYAGRIVWLAQPTFPPEHPNAGQPTTDWLNPDETLRDRPIIGLRILSGLQYDGDGRWSGGRIYAPDEGKSYRVKVTLTAAGALKLRGYIGISLFGRTIEWTPVEEARWRPAAGAGAGRAAR